MTTKHTIPQPVIGRRADDVNATDADAVLIYNTLMQTVSHGAAAAAIEAIMDAEEDTESENTL